MLSSKSSGCGGCRKVREVWSGSGHAEEHRAEVHALRGLQHARDLEQHVAHLGEPGRVRDRHPREALVGEQRVAQAELVRAHDLPLDAHPLEHLDAAELRGDEAGHGVLAVADGLALPPDGERLARGPRGVVEHGAREVALDVREVDDLRQAGLVDLGLQSAHRAAPDLAPHLQPGRAAERACSREVVAAQHLLDALGLAALVELDERGAVGVHEDAGARQLDPGDPGLHAVSRYEEAEGAGGVEVAAAAVVAHGVSLLLRRGVRVRCEIRGRGGLM